MVEWLLLWFMFIDLYSIVIPISRESANPMLEEEDHMGISSPHRFLYYSLMLFSCMGGLFLMCHQHGGMRLLI